MAYRLLLDENVEHEVAHRLENYGHNIEHVDFVPELGKGASDDALAEYSVDTDRVILSYDDDFVLEVDDNAYRAVLYIPDSSIRPADLADIVHTVSQQYPQAELDGVERVSTAWL